VELKIRGLSKSYGAQVALQDVDLDLKPGTIALLGPNGSGKTTLLRCLASLLKPDRGQLWFDGLPYKPNFPRLRGQLGYLPQDLDLPASLTPRRLLEYLSTLKHAAKDSQMDHLLYALGLEEIADRSFARLSGGQVRLAGIAQAFLGRPKLLLLDELTHGLDVEERERVFALARQPVPGRLILFSTHEPSDAERWADSIILLFQGEVADWGRTEELRQQPYGKTQPVIRYFQLD
jgi:ABC-2 type transport system ATP-binding protein